MAQKRAVKRSPNQPLYNPNPWSTRRPQSLILTVLVLVALVAVVIAALAYISDARGGVVPVLMLAVAPVLAIYYVWYFNFNKPPTPAKAAVRKRTTKKTTKKAKKATKKAKK